MGGDRPAPVDRHPHDLLTSLMSLTDQHTFVSANTVRDNLTMWIPEAPDKTLVAAPYKAVEGWLKPSLGEGFTFGGNSGVSAESPDHMSHPAAGQDPPARPRARQVRRRNTTDNFVLYTAIPNPIWADHPRAYPYGYRSRVPASRSVVSHFR